MKKIVTAFLISMIVLSGGFGTAFALEPASTCDQVAIKEAQNETNSLLGYKKVNVSTTYEWGPYQRVSADLTTKDGKTGTISSDRQITFATQVTENISGLGIGTSGTVTTKIGYTLTVPANSTRYMAYRQYYKVEKGTRQCYNIANGNVVSSNSYTVKTPQTRGEYTLLKP